MGKKKSRDFRPGLSSTTWLLAWGELPPSCFTPLLSLALLHILQGLADDVYYLFHVLVGDDEGR